MELPTGAEHYNLVFENLRYTHESVTVRVKWYITTVSIFYSFYKEKLEEKINTYGNLILNIYCSYGSFK